MNQLRNSVLYQNIRTSVFTFIALTRQTHNYHYGPRPVPHGRISHKCNKRLQLLPRLITFIITFGTFHTRNKVDPEVCGLTT